jgi:uncharacterized RDD family membrane protein YckC
MTTLSEEPGNPYAPPQAAVNDAETADTELVPELASRMSRLGAVLLDGVIAGVLCLLPLFIGFDAQAFSRAATAKDDDGMVAALSTAGLTGAVLGALIWVVLTLYLVARDGQTLGKKVVGIKVVRADGSRASLGRIFWLRNVANSLPGFIPLLGNFYSLLDHLFIFGSRNQCLHDRIADTIVVDA